jgi:hypothetical protein
MVRFPKRENRLFLQPQHAVKLRLSARREGVSLNGWLGILSDTFDFTGQTSSRLIRGLHVQVSFLHHARDCESPSSVNTISDSIQDSAVDMVFPAL